MPARLEWERHGKRNLLTIVKQEVMIGRDPGCQVRGDAADLSARHCRILHDGTQFVVEHLSGGATLVNGVPIARHGLDSGDVIECGSLTVRFHEDRRARPRPAPAQPVVPPAAAPASAASAASAPSPPPSPVAPAPDLAELPQLRAALVRAGEDRDRERDEAIRLRAMLDQRADDLRRADGELARTRKELDQASTSLAAAREELRVRDEQLVEKDRLIAVFHGQLDDRDRQLRDKDRELDSQASELHRLEARARELFDASQGLRAEVARAREQSKALETKHDDLARENARLQHNLSKVTNTLAEYQQSMQSLESQLRELQVLRDRHAQVIESQQEELQVLGAARNRVQILLDDLQRQHHHLDVSHELLKAENAKLAPENARLVAEAGRLQLEIQRMLRDRIPDRSLQDALIEIEALRKELGEAQRALGRLTVDRELFDRLRALAESHARDLPPGTRSPQS